MEPTTSDSYPSSKVPLEKLEGRYLECRVRRHRWYSELPTPVRGRRIFEGANIARLVSRCDRCGTVREQVWSRITGEQLFSTYHHPAGYRLDSGKEGSIAPSQMRLEYLARVDPPKSPKRRRG